MNIAVKNRDQVEGNGIAIESDYVLISISCPNDAAKIKERPWCKDILRLEFDDLDQPVHILGGLKCKLFQREDARAILDFFNKHKNSYEYLIVHCDAGISRSPAVAAALTKIQSGFDEDYFKRYLPNRRVYSLLLSEFYENENPQAHEGAKEKV